MITESNRNFTLKSSVILRIRSDKRLRNKLTLEMDTTHSTLYRWLRINDIRLTTVQFLSVISNHTGIPVTELTEIEEPVQS